MTKQSGVMAWWRNWPKIISRSWRSKYIFRTPCSRLFDDVIGVMGPKITVWWHDGPRRWCDVVIGLILGRHGVIVKKWAWWRDWGKSGVMAWWRKSRAWFPEKLMREGVIGTLHGGPSSNVNDSGMWYHIMIQPRAYNLNHLVCLPTYASMFSYIRKHILRD